VAANLKGRLARMRRLAQVDEKGKLADPSAFGLVRASRLGDRAEPEGSGNPTTGTGDRAARNRAASRPRSEAPSFLSGWEQVGELAWTRTLRRELSIPPSLDPACFAPLRSPRSRPASAVSASVQGRVALEELRFFDLETTGLSGGTGTVAFLAAIGRSEGSDFRLDQVFLEDFPGENDFIQAIAGFLASSAGMVSYNGRAFDMPLMRTRCVINGLPVPEPALHIDALFAARRLWRSVYGGASLGLLEREVLGVEREEDLPGAMIPEAWLAFARGGDSPLMPLVLSHNAEDVFGLARLVGRLQAVFDSPRSSARNGGLDRGALGRTLLAAGREAEGEELLEAAAGDGDERACLLLSLRYRRAGRIEECLEIAASMPATYRCAVERAKLFERKLGDLSQAARWAAEAVRLARGEVELEAAGRRVERLARKAAGEG
jgi:uncharacterized protein YprB with RNaseH-like and TPR domain